jgi:DNA-binding CsgD family transcriptional regulator/catechol 2,3-dioxygenase-like lactoylglutathione lyase family enzyme
VWRYAKGMKGNRQRGRPPHPDILTRTEWSIAEAVRHGMTNGEIARRRGVSPDAVKYHLANILQKLGFTSRAQLRLWDGVRRDSNLSAREVQMDNQLKLGPVGQIARSVGDIVASRKWYEEVLGLPHLYSFGNLAFFDCGGVRLFLSEGDGGPSESIIYFKVDDVRAAHAALASRGAEFTHAPHMIHRHEDGTEEWMAFFKDNEGRPLGIMAQALASAETTT